MRFPRRVKAVSGFPGSGKGCLAREALGFIVLMYHLPAATCDLGQVICCHPGWRDGSAYLMVFEGRVLRDCACKSLSVCKFPVNVC